MDAAAEEPAQPPPPPLWDESRFQRLVRRSARRKGLTLTDVARLAGTSQNWLSQPATTTGRGIEKVLQVARVLDIEPAELFGALPRLRDSSKDDEHTRRLLTTISTVTAHLAAALQLVDDGHAYRISRAVRVALLQILTEIEAGEDGSGR